MTTDPESQVIVLDFGKQADSGCVACGLVSLFCASLISQSWLQSDKHLPATRCRCGARCYSWSKGNNFPTKKAK